MPQATATALLDDVRAHTYRGLPTWKRVAVLSAGVIVNLLTAVLVFVVILTAVGHADAAAQTRQRSGRRTRPRKAGIVAGDTLVALDGKKLADWQALLETLSARKPGDTLSVTYLHADAEKTVRVVLEANEDGGARLGVGTTSVNVRESLPDA